MKYSTENEIKKRISEINSKFEERFNQLTSEYTKEVLDLVANMEEVHETVNNGKKNHDDLHIVLDKVGSWLDWKER